MRPWTRAVPALAAVLLAAAAFIAVEVGGGAQPVSAATPLQQVDVGLNHACALDRSGRVTCWGEDAAGQVSGWDESYKEGRFSQISAGNFFTCGILRSGYLMCWGYPIQEDGSHRESAHEDWETWTARTTQTGYTGWVNWPGDLTFKPGTLSVGNYHACAITTGGEMACWGKAGDDRLVIPKDNGATITDWVMVEAGFANACGIREGGSVVCWGRTTGGRSAGPSGAGPFIDVTVGVWHGCALAKDGSVDCWGLDHAQIGVLKTPPAGVTFTDIEMATEQTYYYACGLQTNGEISCWGLQTALQLTPLQGTWSKISIGGGSSCALNRQGYLGCWGNSDGTERTGYLFSPPSGQFKQTDGGGDFNCAIKQDDTVTCWGGIGYAADFPTTDTFKQIAVGYFHGCGIKTDDTVACWGGVQTAGTPPVRFPYAIAPSGTFKAISAGNDLTCGIRDGQSSQTDGELHCWGSTTHNRQTEPSGTFTHVAVGASHVCAIKTDKTATCWGQENFFDRDSDGNPDDLSGFGNPRSTTPPSGSHKYTAISAGEHHACAIREDKKAVCWGYHADSRQYVPGATAATGGFGDLDYTAIATGGFGDLDYTAIATGGQPNCAIREGSGALSCWNNEKSQYLPGPEVRAMRGFTSLGAGSFHMCGIRGSGGTLVCWGAAKVIPFPSQFAPPPSRPPSGGGGGGGVGGGPSVPPPEFAERPSATRTVSVSAQAGDAVGDPLKAKEPGGGTITYVLLRSDGAPVTVDPKTGQVKVKEGAELKEGDTFKVYLAARGPTGAMSVIDVTITVTGPQYHAYDTDKSGAIDLDEAVAAVGDYMEGKISQEELLEILRLYFES